MLLGKVISKKELMKNKMQDSVIVALIVSCKCCFQHLSLCTLPLLDLLKL